MLSWNEEKIKIFMLTSMIQTLKRRVETESASESLYVNISALKDEYQKLLEFLKTIDPNAPVVLPQPISLTTIDDVKYAVDQLNNYMNAKAIPLLFDLMNFMMKVGMVRFEYGENPLLPIMPILTEWGLSINWALGASALTLIEVIVNKKLEELKLSREGSFEERVKRLSERAKQKKVQLPDLLASPFYEARNKVVHAGKEPSPEELKIIFEYLNIYSSSLKNI